MPSIGLTALALLLSLTITLLCAQLPWHAASLRRPAGFSLQHPAGKAASLLGPTTCLDKFTATSVASTANLTFVSTCAAWQY